MPCNKVATWVSWTHQSSTPHISFPQTRVKQKLKVFIFRDLTEPRRSKNPNNSKKTHLNKVMLHSHNSLFGGKHTYTQHRYSKVHQGTRNSRGCRAISDGFHGNTGRERGLWWACHWSMDNAKQRESVLGVSALKELLFSVEWDQ